MSEVGSTNELELLRRTRSRLTNRNRELLRRLGEEQNLLIQALHELALVQKKEPQHFMRTWLRSHRAQGGEALHERS